MKKVAFYTLGCKVNQYETNGMIQKFIANGDEIVEFEDYADIYIINTCTVTSISDKKSRQFIRQAKKINPKSIVVACGCYAQVAKEELEKIEEIDLIVGTNEKANIIEYINNFINSNNKVELEDILHEASYDEFGSVSYTEKTRAVIKVQDGCDRFCTYCIIPFARGKIRSRNPQNVIDEINKISSEGIKEVVITGIHIASYGKDFNNGYELIDLLEEINNVEGIERIRLGSIEPLLISDEFVERLSKLDKICHHFHLSLQSGCDETLKRMNRRYSCKEFEEVVNRLRKTYDDVILTTDIIVGFAGETDEEFNKTFEYLKKINFYKMHIFKYSQRKGTRACEFPNQNSPEIKEIRSKKLLELSDNNQLNYLNSYIGKIVEVLIEEKEDADFQKGHTQNYIMVKTKCDEDLSGKIVQIKVEKVDNLELVGNLVTK